MFGSRGVAAAAPCCSSSLAGSSRCVVVVAAPQPLLRRLVISKAVAPPFPNNASSFPAADASPFVIRPPETDSEFYAIAALRAEAYYADQPGGGGRFVESYKKQFREQEARSLRERVAPRRRRKEGGFLKVVGGSGSGSGGTGGGGGVFGGVLGALVGRAADAAAAADSSDKDGSSSSSSSSSSSADLFLPPECECLAAVEVAEEEEEEEEVGEGERSGGGDDDGESASPSSPPSSSSVVLGALDLRPPRSAGGGHPAGVPPEDADGCAVLNVAVHPSARRRGVARALLNSAAEVASRRWRATALYTTVAATNAGARALYADFGFVEVVAAAKAAAGAEGEGGRGSGGGLPATTLVGRELLLRAEL